MYAIHQVFDAAKLTSGQEISPKGFKDFVP